MTVISVSPGGAKVHTLTWIRINQIARYRIAGVRNERIAAIMQLSTANLNAILAMPEYKEVEESLMLGHITEMDKALAGKIEPLRNELRQGVPSALRCLLDVANQRRDLKAALAASCEILERDPDRVAIKRSASDDGESVPTVPDSVLDKASKDSDLVASQLSGSSDKKLPVQ
jgi:hypothetical protein